MTGKNPAILAVASRLPRFDWADALRPEEYERIEYGGLPVMCRMLSITLCGNIFYGLSRADNLRHRLDAVSASGF
jgi:hypothetical protein